MAKVKDPLEIKYRSTHGNITMASTHVGLCARSHYVPTKRARFSGKIITSRQAILMNAWRTFSLAQKAVWNQFGIDFPGFDKYGESIVWSGFNWFIRFSSLQYSMTGVIPSIPPPDPIPSFNPVFIVSWSGPGNDATLVCAPSPGPLETVVSLRKLNSPVLLTLPLSRYFSYKYLKTGDFPSPILATAEEIFLGGFQQNFCFYAIDSLGRRTDNVYLNFLS